MTDVYLVDTSVWIEFLRGTGSPGHLELKRLLRDEPHRVALTEPIAMEIHSGATSSIVLGNMQKLTAGIATVPFDANVDFHDAAAAFRVARSHGITVRTLLDCLIAAVAMRAGVTLLHRDRDFEHLAAVLPDLRTRSLR
jgi:predicted nucleic acid-binding protein